MALTEIPIELSSTPSIVDGGNATAITIDSSENVGVGVAPIGTGLNIKANGSAYTDGALSLTDSDSNTRTYITHANDIFAVSMNDGAGDGIIMSGAGAVTVANGLTLTDGNVVVANGHGIDFSAQTATSASGSSTTAELLDHYEEGTWTPYWSDVSANAIFSATRVESARYTKIGRLVTATCYITTPAGFSTTSSYSAAQGLYIAGLPFASTGAGSDYQAVTVPYYTEWQGFAPPKAPVGWTNTNTTNIVLHYSGGSTGSVAVLPQSTVNAANAQIILTVTYQTNS